MEEVEELGLILEWVQTSLEIQLREKASNCANALPIMVKYGEQYFQPDLCYSCEKILAQFARKFNRLHHCPFSDNFPLTQASMNFRINGIKCSPMVLPLGLNLIRNANTGLNSHFTLIVSCERFLYFISCDEMKPIFMAFTSPVDHLSGCQHFPIQEPTHQQHERHKISADHS